MLDYRMKTFLALCDTMNYTKTAARLNLTQPAVTKHIQHLEAEFGQRLFIYSGKTLIKTERGALLEYYARQMSHNEKTLFELISGEEKTPFCLKLGATKTIGEYVVGEKIVKYMADKIRNISLTVDNTSRLLKQLEDGRLDLVLIEGFFDKRKYEHRLLRREPFIGICATNHPFAGQEIEISRLFSEKIILREKGSGTREIFEQLLRPHNYNLLCFPQSTEISNFSVIKSLVAAGVGISFVYQSVAGESSTSDTSGISRFCIKDNPMSGEFNYVYLKDNILEDKISEFCAV